MGYNDGSKCGTCGSAKRAPGFMDCKACMKKKEAKDAKPVGDAEYAVGDKVLYGNRPCTVVHAYGDTLDLKTTDGFKQLGVAISKVKAMDAAPVGDAVGPTKESEQPHAYKGPASSTYCYLCGYGRLAPIHNGGRAKDAQSDPAPIASASVSKVLRRVHELQEIQMANKPGTPKWEAASKELRPLFKRMAELQKKGLAEAVKPVGDAETHTAPDGETHRGLKSNCGVCANWKTATEAAKERAIVKDAAPVGDEVTSQTLSQAEEDYRKACKSPSTPKGYREQLRQRVEQVREQLKSQAKDAAPVGEEAELAKLGKRRAALVSKAMRSPDMKGAPKDSAEAAELLAKMQAIQAKLPKRGRDAAPVGDGPPMNPGSPTCKHTWQEVDAEPPYDVCNSCGAVRY